MDKERLYRYFSGEATVQDEKEIMDWAEASPENYRIYLKERKWWDAVLIHTPSATAEKAAAKRISKKVNYWMISTVAAAIALLFVLLYPLFIDYKPVETWQSVWAPPGQRAQIVLDDGTTVWLNSQSTLTFPSSFQAKNRTVQLKGEGYFEVKKDLKKPFIVQTSQYDITVLGTSFNVFSYENQADFETSLINGSVRIASNTGNGPAITLRPNEKVTERDGKLVKGEIDSFEYFRWKEGLICVDDEPFENLIRKFSLYFDISIRIENPTLLEYRPTGKFRHSDGVDYALKVLQNDLKFTYTRDKESNEIVIK